MKRFLSLLVLGTCLIITGCDSDSVSEEFDNANGNTVKKLIERVEFTPAQIDGQDYEFTVEYDTNDRVISASNGIETGTLVYEDGELSTIMGGTEPFSMDELYQSPYDVFEEGDVLEYDESGNPVTVSVLEYDYEYINGQWVETVEDYIATITYDAKPNPYFYTFEAAGLIEVMDKVRLNFSMIPQSPDIIQARALFPLNNIKSIVYKNEEGEVVGRVKMDYVYNVDNYPVSATFTVESEEGSTSVYTTKYFYKE